MDNQYTITPYSNGFKIYINGKLHLVIDTTELVGMQSWVENSNSEDVRIGFGDRKYIVEFTMKTNNIKCEYDSKEKWLAILELLDKHL